MLFSYYHHYCYFTTVIIIIIINDFTINISSRSIIITIIFIIISVQWRNWVPVIRKGNKGAQLITRGGGVTW